MSLGESTDARSGSEEKANLGAFAMLLGTAMVWGGFFFWGAPTLDGRQSIEKAALG